MTVVATEMGNKISRTSTSVGDEIATTIIRTAVTRIGPMITTWSSASIVAVRV